MLLEHAAASVARAQVCSLRRVIQTVLECRQALARLTGAGQKWVEACDCNFLVHTFKMQEDLGKLPFGEPAF